MRRRTFLIGLDGATFTILDPLMQAGEMPFLREFLGSAVRSELTSTIPALTPPAWTSLATGCGPGRHGIFDFFCKDSADSGHIRFANSHDIHSETIWSMASRHGRKVTVLNFPLTFPAPAINGSLVPGWMPWRQLRLGCRPAGLYDRLKQIPGFDVRELAMDMALEEKAIEGCGLDEYEDWIRLHIRREAQWLAILERLVIEDPADLTAVLFDGVDKLQHLCWRFIDPAYTDFEASEHTRRIRECCLDYFRQLDRVLARIVEHAGPEATVIIASDHGFGAQTDTFFVNAWLEQRGYLAWADERAPRPSGTTTLGVGQLARHVYLLDWKRTRAYAPTPSSNGIHIVPPGLHGAPGVPRSDYLRFRNELARELKQLRHPDTGEPVVSQVWTREQAFAGPAMDRAPDLTLVLRDGGLISILDSDRPVVPRAEPSGTHRPEGVLIARGPDLQSGVSLPPRAIVDVAPLVLYSLDLPIPGGLDGRLPLNFLAPQALELRPARHEEPANAPRPATREPAPVLDPEAEAEVMRRLKALGYVD